MYICLSVWCISVCLYGVYLSVSMVYICLSVWCISVCQYGVYLSVSMVYICLSVWCMSVCQYDVYLSVSMVYISLHVCHSVCHLFFCYPHTKVHLSILSYLIVLIVTNTYFYRNNIIINLCIILNGNCIINIFLCYIFCPE